MATSVSYIIATRNRVGELGRTLEALGAMGPHEAEVVVVDNASATRPHLPSRLSSGAPVALIGLERNMGAAARNVGARVGAGSWVVMLDDDSHPTIDGVTMLSVLERQPANVGAVMADIRLPSIGGREAGGLPEVFVGCGVALRRELFVALGGYDASMGYYAEEYDLSARLLLEGMRVVFEPEFTVDHRKVAAGRDMGVILGRLVRNNGWVMRRYAPEAQRRGEMRVVLSRYRSIAAREGALSGYAAGLVELRRTLGDQPRRPMPAPMFDRFTGLRAARVALDAALAGRAVRTAAIVSPGKNEHIVRGALAERGVLVIDGAGSPDADVRIIGTLSPGPMIDAALADREAAESGRLIAPWTQARRIVDRSAWGETAEISRGAA